jgi:hypothetical protein
MTTYYGYIILRSNLCLEMIMCKPLYSIQEKYRTHISQSMIRQLCDSLPGLRAQKNKK